MEDPKKPYKPKVKGMSIFPFIFSIFIYISIFYKFNLSPSTLFNNTKFWFLISNTLILIIAADYVAFSSSKDKQGVYNEYFMHNEVRRSSSSFVLEYQEIAKKSNVNTQKREDSVEKMQEKRENESKPLENKMQIVAINEHEKPTSMTQEDQDHIQEKRIVHVGRKSDYETKKNINEGRQNSIYRRSKSERVKKVVIDESKNSVGLRRSETEKYDPKTEGEVMNEFSNMSDEDLNRRVEEFIQRFNRQIRLQAREYYDN